MEVKEKKNAISLGLRVGIFFFMTVLFVIVVAYYVLSQTFQTLLTDYTIKLVSTMTDQGVTMVETELQNGRQEVSLLADAFQLPQTQEEVIVFPEPYAKGTDLIRMVYVTEDRIVASDGRKQDMRSRTDIVKAFQGEVNIYGPFYNEANEFTICYSAPIKRGGEIVGVLSVEKNGYRFSELIKNIRFVESGESYIINAEGTDIAVSDPNHMDWVTSQYNARELLEEEMSEETKSILELEQKGLDGETGLGTYIWNDGLVYVYYQPIPSENWVLFGGMREEELVSMTRAAMYASLSEGPFLIICFTIVFLLAILMIYWIVSNLKKTSEINEKLNVIANFDALTGLMNRNRYHSALDQIELDPQHSLACVYIDANGLHELNNHLGHQAGDDMLKAVADALREQYHQEQVYRIGGDEFVVLCLDECKEEIQARAEQVRNLLRKQGYEVSIGISWCEHAEQIMEVINEAESLMQQDKRSFYKNNEHGRKMRNLDQQIENLRLEKQDADTFLSVLAPEFKGVYFVNLNTDTIRHLFIPEYFKKDLEEAKYCYSKAILLYANHQVKAQYHSLFEELCDYEALRKALEDGLTPTLIYQKHNEDWMKLRVLKFKDDQLGEMETLWIFTHIEDAQEE